jgi:tRNA dimethylallyltransferase
MKPTLVVILGPTAVGKTAVAIEVAKHFGAKILSADSRQLYWELPIGSAQPSDAELRAVPHFFIATNSVEQPVDAGSFAREANKILEAEFQKQSILVMAGGSGLYIDAVINGFDELPEQDAGLREELQTIYNEKGIRALQLRLERSDPVYFAQVDQNNPARLIRAIEVCEISGRPYSELRSGEKADHAFGVIKIGLELPREELYARINERVDRMIGAGLEEEARKVFHLKKLAPLQTVGYKELFDHFEGKTDLPKAIELIKQHTRNYAKRQVTWWRKDGEINWVRAGNAGEAIRVIGKLLTNYESLRMPE